MAMTPLVVATGISILLWADLVCYTRRTLMPTELPLERCYKCDEPTGRAGRSDDSLYCDECGQGPFCSECMEQHERKNPSVTDLQFTIEITESLKEWVEQKATEWDCTEAQIIEVLLVGAIWAVDEGTLIIDRPGE
jgi:hypothetical protein